MPDGVRVSLTDIAGSKKRDVDPTITGFTVRDLRFPTSLQAIGTDPMNSAGENALGYLQYHTDSGLIGTGSSFSNGQGNEILCVAIQALAPRFVGQKLSAITTDFRSTHRALLSGQIRFMSPERGVLQLACNAVLNALWDLWAKVEEKPLWKLVCDMTPEQFVSVIDFRYLTDVITPEEALQMLKEKEATKKERYKEAMRNEAVPGYSTSIGWLGFSDEEVATRLRAALDQGFRHFKLKVGVDLEGDLKRLGLVRKIAGDEAVIMTDVNQLWDVDEAIEYMPKLAQFNLWFIEEPTSPDDILGHAKIKKALKPYGIGVATGEHVNNRVMFKQLLQAEAIDAVQLDAFRLSGMNEILSVLLLAAKFDVPVVPHSGGCGMTEACAHISTIDYVMVSGKKSILEYTDHLHDVFVNPAEMTSNTAHHVSPLAPGYSSDVKEEVFKEFEYPHGTFWQTEKGKEMVADKWRGVPGRQTS
uniref:Mandelate racemase/muconate lactonizing enzyme C-terminal domain-containing protein n=1 Tax=Kwoniella dejecticola CBS 10117 TaxID=1296121 RepID=A0A1A5ZV19_9TREE|nr:uncharacterized protein I303_07561 [Kwoniella dejecticola CBS 10117]OBR81651.1 hypothetical protein I303_07561 [Kwoniella dejecticola CBS 10117]